MPRSILLGRPWPQPGEPLFEPADIDVAFGYAAWLDAQRAVTCPGCGTKHEDWVDPVTRRAWRQPRWVAEAVECHGCEAVADTRDGIADNARAFTHVVLQRAASDRDSQDS